ncbi:MAG TPA: AI-2E family transporter [bacterium]|nr:AI-2E family transporter [bacterium]
MTQREFVGRVVTIIALVAVACALVWVIWQTTEIIILLLVSAVLASGFAPIVEWLEAFPLPRGVRLARGTAIFVVYIGLFAMISGILSLIVIPASAEGRAFVQHLPSILAAVQTWVTDLQARYPWLPDFSAQIKELPQQMLGLGRYGASAASVAFSFLGGVTSMITVLVFSFYMLLQHTIIKDAFLSLLPPAERPRGALVLQRIGAKFGGWFRGQFLLSFTIAAVVSIALLLIGMPYPFLLGIIAGLGELVPMVGLWIGATVAMLVALSQPTWRLFVTIAFFVVIMNVEPHYLTPRIMSREVGLSPLVTLISLLVGIKLLGIIGGLLAIPLAAALQVIVAEVAEAIQTNHPTTPQ